MAVISVPKSLRDQLGDQGADDLVDLLNRALGESREDILVLSEEKFERRLSEETASINQRITEEIAALRADLRTQIAQTRADLIQWMFVFWVGQLAAIPGILFVVFFR